MEEVQLRPGSGQSHNGHRSHRGRDSTRKHSATKNISAQTRYKVMWKKEWDYGAHFTCPEDVLTSIAVHALD
ncbi:hypothetical protein VCV18_005488 [Metarhizium anisopliae]